ncbi:MAG TPA: hypothetical protein VGX49_02130 [Jatrophihabitans sp.]|nr:hypothetical protein [Jatrophihabitans sp.]
MAEPVRRPAQLWLRLALAAGLGLAAGIAVLLVVTAAGGDPRPELCVGIGMATALLVQLVRETATDPQLPEFIEPSEPGGNEYFSRLRQLERRLEAASRDGSKYDRNVRPVLARLATERLRQKYGIDPGRQPIQAREVLGEQLWSLTLAPAEPASPPPSHAQLSTLVAQIEAL